MEDNRRGQSWHLEKTVSISHIISTILIAGSLFGYANSMDKRIQVNSSNIEHLSDIQKREEKNMMKTIDKINYKLDRIIDKFLMNNDKNT